MRWVQHFAPLVLWLAVFMPTAHAQITPILRVSAIPDEAPTELQRKFKPLGAYLAQRLGMQVEFIPVTDYAGVVEGLIGKQLDLVWLGGFTFVQARVRSHDQVVPLVQRAEDAQFRSVFIARADSGIHQLADLKGKSFSFGSPSSTSGHLMPRAALLQQGIDPERDFKQIGFSGSHDATIAAVMGGKVQAGALNISVWQKFVEEHRVDTQVVQVFYTTAPFFDYNWSVRSDLDGTLAEHIRQAFLDLDPGQPEQKTILELQRASRFIPTESRNYDGIEAAARAAGLIE